MSICGQKLACFALLLFAPLLSAETQVLFTLQTNHPFCGTEAEGSMSGSLPCIAKEMYLAGVIASAHSDDPDVVAFKFTATADMLNGGVQPQSTSKVFTEIVPAGSGYYTSVLAWLGRELKDFENVRVTAEPLKSAGKPALADRSGKIATQFAYHQVDKQPTPKTASGYLVMSPAENRQAMYVQDLKNYPEARKAVGWDGLGVLITCR